MGVSHQLVPEVKQVGVAQLELLADAEGAVTFEKTPQYHDYGAAWPLRGPESGGRKHVEVGAAIVALELGYRAAGVLVGMVMEPATFGTGQLPLVKMFDEPIIALLLVHQVFDWKNHGVCFSQK